MLTVNKLYLQQSLPEINEDFFSTDFFSSKIKQDIQGPRRNVFWDIIVYVWTEKIAKVSLTTVATATLFKNHVTFTWSCYTISLYIYLLVQYRDNGLTSPLYIVICIHFYLNIAINTTANFAGRHTKFTIFKPAQFFLQSFKLKYTAIILQLSLSRIKIPSWILI